MKNYGALVALVALLVACPSAPTPRPAPTVNAVDVQPSAVSLEVGDTQQLNATVSVSNGASQAVTWSVPPGGVVTISGTGLVTALGPGEATVTATSQADPSKSDTSVIVVNPPAPTVTGVALDASPSTITAGQTSTLTATVTGTGEFSRAVEFAIVSGSGTITPVGTDGRTATYTAPATVAAPSTVTVRAVSPFDSAASATTTLTVNPAPQVTGLSVSADPTTITVGGTSTITAEVAGTGNFAPGVTLSVVSGPGTLSGQTGTTGTLTGTGAGRVVVRATTVGTPTRTADVEVTVTQPPGATGALAGRVRHSVTGVGIAGATVRVVGGPSVTTGPQGTYTIPDLAPRSESDAYTVTVSAPGFQTSDPIRVTVTANTTTILNVAVVPSGP